MPRVFLNKLLLAGYVDGQPRESATPSGQCCLNFKVAVEWSYKDKETNRLVTKSVSVEVVAWGKTAEWNAPKMHAGTNVLVDGRITQSAYKLQDREIPTLKVTADRIQILDVAEKTEKAEAPSENREESPIM